VVGWFVCLAHAADIVPSLSTRGELEVNKALVGPSTHGVAADTENLGGFPSAHEISLALKFDFTCIFHFVLLHQVNNFSCICIVDSPGCLVLFQ
jgi:hypothetical protein